MSKRSIWKPKVKTAQGPVVLPFLAEAAVCPWGTWVHLRESEVDLIMVERRRGNWDLH
jgi:hypothetical protein